MADTEILLALFRDSGIALVGDLIRDASVDNKFYAFVKTTRSADGAQNPTNFKLRTVAETMRGLGAEFIFVLVEDDKQDILTNTKAMLMRQFPEKIRNVFPTFGPRGVVVWIEPKGGLPAHDMAAIKATSQEFLAFLKISLEGIYITSSENLPTRTACLNSIRFMAPVKQPELRVELERRSFHIPSDEWLSHTLDKLRKSNFIVRAKSGNYSLTLLGLKALGSGKGRVSPDVLRALAMSRRGA